MSGVPQKVKEIADAIRRENPGIDDETKFRIAWSVYKEITGQKNENIMMLSNWELNLLESIYMGER